MILPHNATVAVADGEALTVFRNIGREGEVRLEPMPSPVLHAGATGSGGRHHSSSANHDRSRLAEDAFAAAAAHWLQGEVGAGRIGDLVVVAPPKTLGELRLHYSASVESKLIGEVAKELVGRDAAAVEAAIGGLR